MGEGLLYDTGIKCDKNEMSFFMYYIHLYKNNRCRSFEKVAFNFDKTLLLHECFMSNIKVNKQNLK
jgi:hypothetical protein